MGRSPLARPQSEASFQDLVLGSRPVRSLSGSLSEATAAPPASDAPGGGATEPETPQTPLREVVAVRDAGAAAAAAAASNAQLAGSTRPQSGGKEAASQAAAASPPPRHLEMASGPPGLVVDASAVTFHAAAAPAASREGLDRRRLVVALVGLPARGKSFTAHKLTRYLCWMGYTTRHFNVGRYRRDFVGGSTPLSYFSSENAAAVSSRAAVARLCCEDMLRWMEEGGQVGIFDATNSTRERRAMLLEMCTARKVKLIFLEVCCSDPDLIRRNVLEKVHSSPDYTGVDHEQALDDFMRRMEEYERVYEPLRIDGSEGFSFIRANDIASSSGEGSLHIERCQGFLPGRIAHFLLNSRLAFRPVFLCRHGCSMDNEAGLIGGDSSLAPPGIVFADSLRAFVVSLPPDQRPSAVWTSTLRRTVQTAAPLGALLPQVQWRALDEIDAGLCEGMTYEEVQKQMPEEAEARRSDKLRYRYPRGESYTDVISRLEPVIIELERQRSPVLIIAHQAVLRCLTAYFTHRGAAEVPHLPLPLHTVIQLTPSSYGMREDLHVLAPGPV